MKLLPTDAGALGIHSVSRRLTARIVADWRAGHRGTSVEYLELAANTPHRPSIDSPGFRRPPGTAGLSKMRKRENAFSDNPVGRFLAAVSAQGA